MEIRNTNYLEQSTTKDDDDFEPEKATEDLETAYETEENSDEDIAFFTEDEYGDEDDEDVLAIFETDQPKNKNVEHVGVVNLNTSIKLQDETWRDGYFGVKMKMI